MVSKGDIHSMVVLESVRMMIREEKVILEEGRLEVECPNWASFSPERRREIAERQAALIRLAQLAPWN